MNTKSCTFLAWIAWKREGNELKGDARQWIECRPFYFILSHFFRSLCAIFFTMYHTDECVRRQLNNVRSFTHFDWCVRCVQQTHTIYICKPCSALLFSHDCHRCRTCSILYCIFVFVSLFYYTNKLYSCSHTLTNKQINIVCILFSSVERIAFLPFFYWLQSSILQSVFIHYIHTCDFFAFISHISFLFCYKRKILLLAVDSQLIDKYTTLKNSYKSFML